jgi:single-strand DNA-binding protein
MNSLNSVLIEGNLTADPERREHSSGAVLCKFTVASERFYSQAGDKKKEVSFFDVEVWNLEAERCLKALSKGSGVRVVGRLKQDRWTDRDGKAHSKVKVVGESVEFRSKFTKQPVDVESPADGDSYQDDEIF